MVSRIRINGLTIAVLAGGLLPAASALGQGHAGGHGFHMPMPDQELYLQCRLGDGDAAVVESVIRPPSSMAPADLHDQLVIPQLSAPVRIVQYLPRARQLQEVTAGDPAEGRPAVRVQIAGRKQSFELWLVADHPERNRLTSLIGTWRYMAVVDRAERDTLFEQFEHEFTRAAQVLVAGDAPAAPAALAAEPGETREFSAGRQRITVRAFMPHFGLDETTKKPVNQSQKRLNPAVLVEVTQDGKTQAHWLFAKFPDFQAHGTETLPLRMRLDCPIEVERAAPDTVVVTIERNQHEVWIRHEGKITTRNLDLHEPVDVPGTSYVFALTAFVPFGCLVESYESADDGDAVTALRIELPDASGRVQSVWLELGKPRVVGTSAGTLNLTFASRPGAAPRGG